MADELAGEKPSPNIPNSPERREAFKKIGVLAAGVLGAGLIKTSKPSEKTPQVKPESQAQRKEEVTRISKSEGLYSFWFGTHVVPRNPDKLPKDLDAIVFEGSAGTLWAREVQLVAVGMSWAERIERLAHNLPVEEEAGIPSSSRPKIEHIINNYYRYQSVEYKSLFPKLESKHTPILLADMEFSDTLTLDNNLLIKSIDSLDDGLWNLKEELIKRFPDAAPTAQDIQQVLGSVLDTAREKVYDIQDKVLFDAMVYPMMVALTEGVIGAQLLIQIIEDSKQLTRRDFLKKVGTGFKTATAVWLSMPLIESLLFLGFGKQGEFVHPELRKLIEKTHPETWFFILTLRNVVLAQKEQWLMEQTGGKPHIATTIGSAHTGLEDQIRKSPKERLKFLRAVKPLLEGMFVPESVYKMVQFEFSEKRRHWRPTKIFEIPELKELVQPQTHPTEIAQKDHVCIDQPKMVVEGEETLLDRAELKEFQESAIGGAPLQIDGIPGEESSWNPGTVHFEVKKFRNRKEMVGVISIVTGWSFKDHEWSAGYEAYILSTDLKRNLDIAPWHIKPVVSVSSMEGVPEAEDKPRSRDNVVVQQIRFYVDEKNAEEIKKSGCTVLIRELGRIDDSPIKRFTRKHLTFIPVNK